MTVTFPRVLQQLAPAGGPFAGREKEIDTLRRAWADAFAGDGGVVLLSGQAGVGKTRLAAVLAGEVDEAGGCVLVGACWAHGADPYQPLVDALGPLPAGERDRTAMVETMAAGVVARALRTPVLLVLDDLHRADRSTLLAVRRIVEVAGDASVLVVATYRDGSLDRSHPLSELLAALLPRTTVERIHVEGLPPDAVAEMVGEADLGKRLWRRSGGNPVWVAELLRPGALDGTVPAEFADLVARRVARLSSSARAFLHAAAIAGSEFDVEVVATAARISSGRSGEALKQAVAAGFVVEEPVGPGRGRRFVHEMVRDAVDDGVSPSSRIDLHLRVGRALEKQKRGAGAGAVVPSALLAWHFRAATPVGVSGRVLHHATAAGDRAMELLAWDEAAAHFGNALAAATGVSSAVRADLLLSLGEAQHLAGEGARARQAFFEAAGQARARGDGARMARAALALGQLDAVWGADPELEAVAREARALLGQASLPAASLPSAADFASETLYDMLDGPLPGDGGHAPAAFGGERSWDRGDAVALLRARHVALAGPEHAAERLAAAEQLVALAETTGDLELAATGQGWRLVDALQLGRHREATAALDAHSAAARSSASPVLSADAAAWAAMRAMLDGRPEGAGVAAADAFDLAVVAGDPDADDAFLLQRWWFLLEWGAVDEVAELVEDCRLAVSRSAPAAGRVWRAALALALARDGHLDLAAEELRRVTDHGLGELLREPGRLHPLSCLVEVAWTVGDTYRAAILGELLEPFAGQVVVAGRARVCGGSVARACGLAAASARRWDDAERHFRAALAVHREMGASPLLARTRFEWSIVLSERNRRTDRRRAREYRQRASELAAGAGMTRLLAEIARRAS